MNTQVEYMYRDAYNFKEHSLVILEGELTSSQIENIKKKLNNEDFFLPGQVGLEVLHSFSIDPDIDHPWHELKDILIVESTPNCPFSAQELYNNFMVIKEWEEAQATKEMFNLI